MRVLKTIIAASLLALSANLSAHTGIQSTYPGNEEILEQAPKQLEFTFKGAVRLMAISLTNTQKKAIKVAFKPSAKAKKSFEVILPNLSLGQYNVKWISMGKDGHKIKGNFSFMIHELAALTE